MIIANPLYDVVFKYLMEDLDIAKGVLETILGVKIERLTFKPQEMAANTPNSDRLKVFRLDFKAVIVLPNEERKTVLIELQKAKKTHDIMRFRGYLGENYQSEEPIENTQETEPLELVSIYILGFKLNGVPVPVLKVGRSTINAVTGEAVQVNEPFINLLTHESYTIQIPRLQLQQQNELEQVLEIFSQRYVTEDKHNLDFQGTPDNPLVQRMLRRLTTAIATPEMRKQMQLEDSFERIMHRELGELRTKVVDLETQLEQEKLALEQERQEKEALMKELAALRNKQ